MNTITDNTYRFSTRYKNLPSSFLREILKIAADKDVISFAGGLPDPALFPLEELELCATRIFREHGHNLLQYSQSEGLPSLKEWICDYYYTQFQLKIRPEQLLITNGSQQGLDLIGKAFLDKGDQLVLEQPTYLGAIQAFMAYEPTILPVALRHDGVDLEELQIILNTYTPKLLYLVSNFQNPSGVTLSEEKRKTLAALAEKHKLMIVEDDPYGQLRFEGKFLNPLCCYSHNIIHCGSFSKIIAPGLRLGWILADESIIRKLLVLKQASDLHCNNLSQRLADSYLRNFSLETHLDKLRNSYRKKCSIMFDAANHAFPKGSVINKPEGGMFLWVELPECIDTKVLLDHTLKENVLFVPGSYFFTNGKGLSTMRLNFTHGSEEIIEKGIFLIGKVMKKRLL